MIKAVCILFVSFVVQITFGQVDSNKFFLESKGKWKLPVKNGYILERNFHEHSSSMGMNIFCDSSMEVHAVFEGEVILVNEYDSVFIVVVKYADYFIGYSNLESPCVKKGDRIKAGDKIGYTGKNLDEVYGVDISLSKNQEDIDPSAWFTYEVIKTPSKQQ
jgi:septal ring factor EnvC (AmiA/AmiB activator)